MNITLQIAKKVIHFLAKFGKTTYGNVEITGSFNSEFENGGSHETASEATQHLGMNSFLNFMLLNYSCLVNDYLPFQTYKLCNQKYKAYQMEG